MNTAPLTLAALLCLCPSAAPAQVRLGISIGLPAAPQMELIAPGIQVVSGFQEEVFLQGGWYWCRRPEGWYRSRNGQAHFDYVESRRVPRGLARMPQGHYRNWHREDRGDRRRMHEPRGEDHGHRGEGERHGEGDHGRH